MVNRLPPIFGPEPWHDGWCHWDLWMCLVSVADYDDTLDVLEERFVNEIGEHRTSRAGESKWSHLVDLRRRLASAGTKPSELVTNSLLADRTLMAKARRKVAGTELEHRAMTEAMIETPRAQLGRRALYGWWPLFPSSPTPWYERFQEAVERKRSVSAGRTFDTVSTLEERLDGYDRSGLSPAERLGLYRALHSALVELIERADDSYGGIGRFRDEVWETYLAVDWRQAGALAEVYYRDLCELLVWENHGLGYRRTMLPFERVTTDEVPVVEAILDNLEREHRAVHLRWQADEAACQVAWLLVATNTTERFVGTAARLGSDNWQPIVAMAEAALEADGKDAASEVFAAANRPGFHRGYLAEQCLRLTGRSLRHLDAVESGPERS
jgi:hypothetical protein